MGFSYFWCSDAYKSLTASIDNNCLYSSTSLGTWSSTSDVDTFLSKYTHQNGYSDGDTTLALGNYVTIKDGTYNVDWMIAGFDCEYMLYTNNGCCDNGYGIAMIPATYITTYQWGADYTADALANGYSGSYIHTFVNGTVATNLQNVLGSHLINRSVLLSNGVDSSNKYKTNSYIKTTAYATLMSIGQVTGTFGSYNTIYDDGEANYKLPVFNYTSRKGYTFWTRNILGCSSNKSYVWHIDSLGKISQARLDCKYDVRPLIYLR